MKIIISITLTLFLAVAANAEFRTWTNSAGKEANLDLVATSEEGGEKVGEFRMRNGAVVKLKQSDLSDADAEALKNWSPLSDGGPSVFDDVLDGNLVKLDGGSLKKAEGVAKPNKYYVFYYTASWCGPCQRFTPSLVKWYEDNKNDNFELVLISSDRDKNAMEGYAKSKKMPWPQLKLSKARVFKSKYEHGVSGIPSLIVCDLEGKVLGNYRSRLPELSAMVK